MSISIMKGRRVVGVTEIYNISRGGMSVRVFLRIVREAYCIFTRVCSVGPSPLSEVCFSVAPQAAVVFNGVRTSAVVNVW